MSLARKNNFIKGYIQIEVEGFFIERFLNTCAKEGIKLWGTKRKNKSIVTTNIHIENFKKIRKIAKKARQSEQGQKKKKRPASKRRNVMDADVDQELLRRSFENDPDMR